MRRDVAFLGILSALAIIIGYVESIIPVLPSLPGVKLGLTNLVIILVLYKYSIKEAILVSFVRIIIIGLLFGTPISIAFSISGSLFAIIIMFLAKKSDLFSVAGTSIAGGFAHNIGQLLIAYFMIPARAVFGYMPILGISGAITGLIIGLISMLLLVRLDKIKAWR